jgi:hypothetical protein
MFPTTENFYFLQAASIKGAACFTINFNFNYWRMKKWM